MGTGALPGPGKVSEISVREMIVSVFSRIVCLLVLLLCQAPSYANAKEPASILLFGDSIIAGYGLSEEQSVPARLQALLRENYPGTVVINGGVSGDTTAAGRSRLAWTLDKHQPSMVMLALGGNDMLRGISPQVTRNNIVAMLDMLRQRGIPTVLSAVEAPDNWGRQYRDQFNAIYTDAAKTYNVPLYPFLLIETYGRNEMMQPDGIHPNANGADLIARGLAKYLEQSRAL